METVIGIFPSRGAAEQAAHRLEEAGVPRERINLLTPGAERSAIERIPTSDAESRGIAPTIGAVAGTAAGAAAGMQLGAAASLLIPGIGPVIALGVAGAALLGVGGAAAGAAFEGGDEGVPHDELFLYEHALREGKSVLVTLADDAQEAERARATLAAMGAESLDGARERWWVGLREAEAAAYEGDFGGDEPVYRQGFEAALGRAHRGRAYEEVIVELRVVYPGVCETAAFRRGYERGHAYGGGTQRRAA